MEDTAQAKSLRWRRPTSNRPIWAGVALVVILGGILLTYGWLRIDRQISQEPLQGMPIFSRPVEIRVGQELSLEDFLSRLRQLGYQESSETADRFRRSGDTVELQHGDSWSPPGPYSVRFEEGRIESILQQGVPVETALLKPEFLGEYSERLLEKRRFIEYQEIPEVVVQAVLTAEDERFFYHHGIDLMATGRALWTNLRHRVVLQGGSTLTQQLVKNYLLTPERTLRRKLEEAVLATVMEIRFSKPELFEMYVNEIYLGQQGPYGVIGFGQAADYYFKKGIHELTVAEAALLAGMIRAPNRYEPDDDAEQARARRDQVLDGMLARNFISREEWSSARDEELPDPTEQVLWSFEASYFTDQARRELEQGRFEAGPGDQVFTTLHTDLQRAALEVCQEGLQRVDQVLLKRGQEGRAEISLVALDARSGEILAMVGGRDFMESQFNRAIDAYRQPGSTFKPFVYAAALAGRAITLSSILTDQPTDFHYEGRVYSPENYNSRYHGQVTVRRALALSLNVPTVSIAEQIGYPTVSQFAAQAGFSREFEAFPSLALGSVEVTPLELAQAYTLFANGGRLMRARSIRVVGRQDLQPSLASPQPMAVLEEGAAYLITSALQTAVDRGTAASARRRGFRLPAAGKTGTTHDSWFAGYTPELICVVWVGLDEGALNIDGSKAALPIWTDFMKRAAQMGLLSGADFPKPDNVVGVLIDPTTGSRAGSWCPQTTSELFLAGTEPSQVCSQWNHLPDDLFSFGPLDDIYERARAQEPWLDRQRHSDPPQEDGRHPRRRLPSPLLPETGEPAGENQERERGREEKREQSLSPPPPSPSPPEPPRE